MASNKNKTNKPLYRWLGAMVPGIITAAVVFGPSKMTITSKMGAEYGYNLLWIIVVAIFFMAIYTAMAARIGQATDVSFLTTVRRKWGKGMSLAIGIGVFLVTTSFQAGNAIGAGLAMAELTGTPTTIWVLLFSAGAIALLFFRAFYKLLEKFMISVVVLMLLSFLTTCFLAKPALWDVLSGLKPTVPTGSLPLVIAFTASCFSLVGALYQSYLVQEKAKNLKIANNQTQDRSLTGVVLLGVMSAAVMVCAAAVLHASGMHINSAADMGKSLEPLFGNVATILFLTGLLGAAVSSLVGNATVGGTLLGDALGVGHKLDDKRVKIYIALVMVIGCAIATAFGQLPLELIVFAQSVTILIVPIIGFAIYMIGNDGKIMGDLRNNLWVKLFAGLGLLLVLGLAITNARNLFFN